MLRLRITDLVTVLQIWSHVKWMISNCPLSISNHEIATSDRFPISVHKPSFPKSNGTNSDFPFSWTSFKWCHCFKADLLLCSDSPSSSLTFANKLIMLYFHTMNYNCICTWLALCKLMQSNITLTGVICPRRCFVSCHLDCHLSGPLTVPVVQYGTKSVL